MKTNKNIMSDIKTDNSLQRLAELFAPEPLYIVGGYVRNALLDCGSTDIDICSALTPERVIERISGSEFAVTSSINQLGTLKITGSSGTYEYTSFRREQYRGDGSHKPKSVSFDADLVTDALRRDFTINSIYFDIIKSEVVDPLNGISDIENKKIKSCTSETFEVDGLRLLRLVRFAAETGFDIEEQTYLSAKKSYFLIKDIKPERKYSELMLILNADKKYPKLTKGNFPHYKGLRLLKELMLLETIFPKLRLSYCLPQRSDFHKYDVIEHTFQTVKYADNDIRLAALLHDIGKGMSYERSGGKNFYYHDSVGADYITELLGQSGFKAPSSVVKEVEFLVRYHMIDLDGKMSENKVKWFIVKNYSMIEKLLKLKQADYLGCGLFTGTSPIVEKWNGIIDKINQTNTPLSLKELKIDGNFLKEKGCPPHLIGLVLDGLFKESVYNPKLNDKQVLEKLAENQLKHLISKA